MKKSRPRKACSAWNVIVKSIGKKVLIPFENKCCKIAIDIGWISGFVLAPYSKETKTLSPSSRLFSSLKTISELDVEFTNSTNPIINKIFFILVSLFYT